MWSTLSLLCLIVQVVFLTNLLHIDSFKLYPRPFQRPRGFSRGYRCSMVSGKEDIGPPPANTANTTLSTKQSKRYQQLNAIINQKPLTYTKFDGSSWKDKKTWKKWDKKAWVEQGANSYWQPYLDLVHYLTSTSSKIYSDTYGMSISNETNTIFIRFPNGNNHNESSQEYDSRIRDRLEESHLFQSIRNIFRRR